MIESNQHQETLREVKDIRRIMERSSRFISLSGISGVVSGIIALAGAAIARYWILKDHYERSSGTEYLVGEEFAKVELQLLLLALGVFVTAFIAAFFFTWRKARSQQAEIWSPTSRRLLWNMLIPLGAGGLFVLGMMQYDEWRFIAPACLLFYGLALVNASKYTLSDVRYLGYCEIALGLLNMQFIGYGLYFWAVGFGVLHIFYGVIMWWRHERKQV